MLPPSAATTASREQGGLLPAELTSFVGRRQETEAVRRLLGAERLVTLTGIGGIGKTRLALHVAAALRRAFDGVWLIDLSTLREPALLPDVTMQALGLEANAAGDPVVTLTDHLRGKRALLIIDNCEHLAAAAAEFIALLLVRIPTLRVLATSRHALNVSGEHIFPVRPLATPPAGRDLQLSDAAVYSALALFAERAAAAVPDFQLSTENLPDVAALCRSLDGLPLAIELAAVRLRVLSPADMATRLSRQRHVLDGLFSARPARHLTLRAMIDASYELCTPDEQLLWTRLSVFSGGFDLDAVEQVCIDHALPGSVLIASLAGLVEKSILIRHELPHGLRFSLLEVLREYGQDRLFETDKAAEFKTRHADWCRSVVDDAWLRWHGPHQSAILFRLHNELANIRIALDSGLTASDSRHSALHLAGRPWFLWLTVVSEGRQWLERAIAADRAPTSERARCLSTCGLIASIQGDAHAARTYLDEARELSSQGGDSDEAYLADQVRLWSVGLLQPSRAAEQLRMVPPLPENEAAREAGIGIPARLVLATAALAHGEMEAGEETLEQCAHLSMTAGTELNLSYVHWARGLAALLRGQYVEALSWASHSAYAHQDGHLASAEVLDLDLLGWIHVAAGRAELGATLLGAASGQWQAFGHQQIGLSAILLRERAEHAARETLGAEGFDRAFAMGRQMSLQDATALALNQRAGPRGAEASPPAVLTPRELQVVALVAEGLSNKEISQRLVISVRTAETHVERILTKLGFTSRTQIAQWAKKGDRGS